LVAYSALGGAAIGFASTRTIGNFFAGLFLFLTHPFRVNDFVRIDSIEGVVEEITFNYTKIRTQSNTLVFMSNLKILDQNVINFREVGERSRLYCYSILLGFDHSLPVEKLEKTFQKVIDRYAEKLPKKPEYLMQRITAFERVYSFLLYAKKPKEIFTIQPSFVREITEAWENAKAAARVGS
jgi:small-conductance mechanosensitive channel